MTSVEYAVAPLAGRGRITLLLVLIALVIVGIVAMRVWQQRYSEEVAEVPLLLADPTPVRERPVDPGGLDVPYQDVLALHELGGSEVAGEPVVERVLPPPEAPMPRPVPAAIVLPAAPAASEVLVPDEAPEALPALADDALAVADDAGVEAGEALPAPIVEARLAARVEKPARPVGAASTLTEERAVSGADPGDAVSSGLAALSDDSPDPIAAALAMLPEAEPPANVSPDPAPPVNGYMVQLGAFRSAGEAAAGWNSTSSEAADLFAAVRHFVFASEPDSDSDSGVVHRLQVGPMAERGDATSLCEELRQRDIACFVVAR